MKKILTSCLIVLICLTAFISGYSKGCYSYAEDIHYMSDAELEAAYQAYLQSKGGGLLGNAGARLAYSNGKMLNFLTSDANTTPYKNINDIKGLMNWQKTELESGNSSVLQLAMSQGGASVFSLYTQWLLQNHFFGNGVTEDNNGMFTDGTDNLLYSGIFVTVHGQTALLHIIDSTNTSYNGNLTPDKIQMGTPYMYTTEGLMSRIGKSTNLVDIPYYTSNTYSINLKGVYSYTNGGIYGIGQWAPVNPDNTVNQRVYYKNSQGVVTYTSYIGLWRTKNWSNENTCVGGIVLHDIESNTYTVNDMLGTITLGDKQDTNIIFNTNNNNNILVFPTINEGDNLYITPKVKVEVDGTVNYQSYTVNEGDDITNIVNNYYQDSGDPDKTITIPSTTPDGGGSGGGNDNPSGGNPPSWNNPFPHLSPDGEGGFNFNFNLPDLNIDWNISGLQEKFPFSIPFDLIHFVQVLNAEPETPEFDWTIDLKIYQWHIDADLHQFDNLAGIVRNVEFIGFCITLVLITRKMIKG